MKPALRRLLGAPALQALVLQFAAFPLTLAAVFVLARLDLAPSWLAAVLLQGVFAAALTWWRRLAPWWRAIQLLFPLAVVMAQRLELPPAMFLAVFLFLLLLYWSTFRTQVPYYPSSRALREVVAGLLPPHPVRVIDIGSGLGGLVLDLARRRPDCECSGIELAPLPWAVGRLRAWLAGSRATLLRGDYEHLDFGAYDLVFAYLSPAAMDALWRKAAREMRPGSLLLSYEFDIPGHPPERRIVVREGGPALAVWHF